MYTCFRGSSKVGLYVVMCLSTKGWSTCLPNTHAFTHTPPQLMGRRTQPAGVAHTHTHTHTHTPNPPFDLSPLQILFIQLPIHCCRASPVESPSAPHLCPYVSIVWAPQSVWHAIQLNAFPALQKMRILSLKDIVVLKFFVKLDF